MSLPRWLDRAHGWRFIAGPLGEAHVPHEVDSLWRFENSQGSLSVPMQNQETGTARTYRSHARPAESLKSCARQSGGEWGIDRARKGWEAQGIGQSA